MSYPQIYARSSDFHVVLFEQHTEDLPQLVAHLCRRDRAPTLLGRYTALEHRRGFSPSSFTVSPAAFLTRFIQSPTRPFASSSPTPKTITRLRDQAGASGQASARGAASNRPARKRVHRRNQWVDCGYQPPQRTGVYEHMTQRCHSRCRPDGDRVR